MTHDPKSQPDDQKPTHAGAEAAEGMKSAAEERTTEHESGYGGKGGEPRTSSDQRESTDDDGSLRSESNKR